MRAASILSCGPLQAHEQAYFPKVSSCSFKTVKDRAYRSTSIKKLSISENSRNRFVHNENNSVTKEKVLMVGICFTVCDLYYVKMDAHSTGCDKYEEGVG